MFNRKTLLPVLLIFLLISGCGIKSISQNDQALHGENSSVFETSDVSKEYSIETGSDPEAQDSTTETSESDKDTVLSYKDFKSLSNEEQLSVFEKLSSQEIYYLVKSSDSENWPVTAYDLVTENNAKEFIILNEYNGSLSFNLNWPVYGGYDAYTIASIQDLSGTAEVSRDGGDSGHTMCYGRNEDGSLANNSQRSIPKTTATVRTGILDIDRYKQVVDVITGEEYEKESLEDTDNARISALQELGFTEEDSINLMSDYNAWLIRPEIIGENSIADGVKSVGHQIESRYGYYGNAAPWEVSDLKLVGGCKQMNTVFSWGTLNSSGLITEPGTETIN